MITAGQKVRHPEFGIGTAVDSMCEDEHGGYWKVIRSDGTSFGAFGDSLIPTSPLFNLAYDLAKARANMC